MHVARMELTNFRCYERLELELPRDRLVLVGANAQGKSSLMEAVFVAATTRSPFTSSDRDMVRWDTGDDGLGYGQVAVQMAEEAGRHSLDVVYVLNDGTPDEPELHGVQARVGGGGGVTKRVRVDGSPRRALDALGILRVVLFAPQDLALVDGAPSVRRRYLDVLLCQVNRDYCRALSHHSRVVSQRNSLLRNLRERGHDAEELEYWDQELARSAACVLEVRHDAVGELETRARGIHRDLVGGAGRLSLAYDDSTSERCQAVLGAAPDRAADALEEATLRLLPRLRREEIARGLTVVGPHRDDLIFTVDGVEMRAYGSRGQQRTVALATKLAEADLMAGRTGEEPVLLLDDVLSELDAPRRGFLAERLPADRQTVLTTTDLEHVPASFLAGATILRVASAAVAPEAHVAA